MQFLQTESKDCPIAKIAKPVDQKELWQRIDALPKDLQKCVGKIFVGNRQWAQSVRAARDARLALEREQRAEATRRAHEAQARETQRMIDDFWLERMVGMCGT